MKIFRHSLLDFFICIRITMHILFPYVFIKLVDLHVKSHANRQLSFTISFNILQITTYIIWIFSCFQTLLIIYDRLYNINFIWANSIALLNIFVSAFNSTFYFTIKELKSNCFKKTKTFTNIVNSESTNIVNSEFTNTVNSAVFILNKRRRSKLLGIFFSLLSPVASIYMSTRMPDTHYFGVVTLLTFHIFTSLFIHFIIGWCNAYKYSLLLIWEGTHMCLLKFTAWISITISALAFLILLIDHNILLYVACGLFSMVTNLNLLLFISNNYKLSQNITTSCSHTSHSLLYNTITALFIGLFSFVLAGIYYNTQLLLLNYAILIGCLLSLIICSVMSHAYGTLLYDSSFPLFSFSKLNFICYFFKSLSLSCILFIFVFLWGSISTSRTANIYFLICSLLGIITQLCSHLTVYYYNKCTNLHWLETKRFKFNILNEQLLALFINIISTCVLVLVDKYSIGVDHSTIKVIFGTSLMMIVSIPLSHFSWRHSTTWLQLIIPMYGSKFYLCSQTLGWVVYGIGSLFIITQSILLYNNFNSVYKLFAYSHVAIIYQLVFILNYVSNYVELSLSKMRSEKVNDFIEINDGPNLKTSTWAMIMKCALDESTLSSKIQLLKSLKTNGVYITFLSCFISSIIIISSGLIRGTKLNTLISNIILVILFIIISLISLLYHILYGPLLYPNKYKIWYPFGGGKITIVFQILAVSMLILNWILVYIVVYSDTKTLAIHLIISILNISSLSFLFLSIYNFKSKSNELLFLQKHYEVILSLCFGLAAFSLTYVYDMINTLTALSTINMPFQHRLTLIPLLLSITTILITIPFIIKVYDKLYNAIASQSESIIQGRSDIKTQTNEELIVLTQTLALMLSIFLALMAIHSLYYATTKHVCMSITLLRISSIILILFVSFTYVFMHPEVNTTLKELLYVSMESSFVIVFTITVIGYTIIRSTPLHYFLVFFVVVIPVIPYKSINIFFAFFLIALISITLYDVHNYVQCFTLGRLKYPSGYVTHLYWCIRIIEDSVFSLLIYYYYSTLEENPVITGSMKNEKLISFIKETVLPTKVKYFNYSTIFAGTYEDKPYILGCHPHGICAISTFFVLYSNEFIRKFHNITLHVATQLVSMPIMRELSLRLGLRSVTKNSIIYSLREGNSVIVVPGGQADVLVHSHSELEIKITTHHVGFIRLAIQQQIPAVPILLFGEHCVLSNISIPSIQRTALKYFKSVLPFMPYGRYYTPIPKKVKLTTVVGKPIHIPLWYKDSILNQNISNENKEKDTERAVDEMYHLYYQELKHNFETYKAEAGYPNIKLTLLPRYYK